MKAWVQLELGEIRPIVSLLALMMATFLWLTPETAVAQQAELVAASKREFHGHCAVCHGLGGKGERVMTTFNLLTVRPADLTRLSKRNKGQFPFWYVYRVIDGREEVKGHGTRDMPIWGDVFTDEEGGKLADETRAIGRILTIVHYLDSIQEKSQQPVCLLTLTCLTAPGPSLHEWRLSARYSGARRHFPCVTDDLPYRGSA